MTSIARRLALPFLGFVIAGSLALIGWMSLEEQRQSRQLFAATARTSAEFIRKENLPPSERTASALSEMLGLRVAIAAAGEPLEVPEFGAAAAGLTTLAQRSPGVVASVPDAAYEVVALPVTHGAALFLIRPQPSRFGFLLQPRTLVSLGVFWSLSLALAWVLARGIVRPLGAFASRLPRIAEETSEPIPEVNRADEIGQLARAYAETRAQLAAERAAREKAERLAALGRMATSLAHEINNPVAAIKLHTQLLEGESHGSFPERLEIILSETGKIESLVSQWMFLIRPQPPQTTPCDLAEIVLAGVRSAEPAAAHARVRLVPEMPSGLVASVDRRRLGQAVANILANGIHALAAQGGTLTIRGGRDEAGHLHIDFFDTGPGFSPEALARATELFYSEKEGGMGIGLCVTAEILRAHGGELKITNAPAGGAIVTLLLPAVPAVAQLSVS